MAASIAQQLEELLNPLPKFADPEDDHDEETRAKVIEKFDEGENEDEGVAISGLRKRASAPLSEMDRRYRGKATSRKELHKEAGAFEEQIEDGEDDSVEDDDDCDDDEDGMDDKDAEDFAEGDSDDEEPENESVTSSDDDGARMKALVRKMKQTDLAFPAEMDFRKLTEGMDDIETSGDDEEGSEQEEEGDESEEEQEVGQDSSDEDGCTVMTFSKEKVDEEVEKGKAVKNQLALWDQLLEGRIRLQKALLTANQLPQQQTFPEFKVRGGAEFSGALKNSHKALKALQRSLLELQDQLLHQNLETRSITLDKAAPSSDGEEVLAEEEEQRGPPKRKLEMADYPDFMSKRFADFQPYRDGTLQKWHDKTRLTMGKAGKGFGAFDRNILTQVEHVLSDPGRLVRRTQTKRTEYRVLGRPEPTTTEAEGDDLAVKANAHLKDLDEEIFDDDDFYHQLLRELIDRKTCATDPNDQVAMGRQWLAIQKLRSKIKKKVDTKASKGRKVRYHVHSKLVNFMAPIDHSSMNDNTRTELYRSLFGKISSSDRIIGD